MLLLACADLDARSFARASIVSQLCAQSEQDMRAVCRVEDASVLRYDGFRGRWTG